jgi:hypothetical protein
MSMPTYANNKPTQSSPVLQPLPAITACTAAITACATTAAITALSDFFYFKSIIVTRYSVIIATRDSTSSTIMQKGSNRDQRCPELYPLEFQRPIL